MNCLRSRLTSVKACTTRGGRLGLHSAGHPWAAPDIHGIFYDDDHAESQRTLAIEQRGPLAGRRVIRGRERKCRSYYEALETAVMS